MDHYFVNKNAQKNGDHEVHRDGCSFTPQAMQRISLGFFNNCHKAVRAAREHYPQVNGCYYCSEACHTG